MIVETVNFIVNDICLGCRQFSSTASQNEVNNGAGDGGRCERGKVSFLFEIFVGYDIKNCQVVCVSFVIICMIHCSTLPLPLLDNI